MNRPANSPLYSASSPTETAEWRYSQEVREQFAETIRQDGFCILPHFFPVQKLQAWKSAFDLLLKERIANGTASERGSNRYYISLPFTMPFADPAIYADRDILDIVERVAEGEVVMPELATDTPLQNSEYQIIHRDHLLLSPDLPHLDAPIPFQFGINFPLVDVTLENGPFEIAPGTHRLSDEECQREIDAGTIEKQLTPLLMSVGDVMIRDVRALHRGTPNRTENPRPMVVVGYNRVEHRRPQLRIFIPRDIQETFSERSSHLLRLNPVVDSLEQAQPEETYSDLYFLEQ